MISELFKDSVPWLWIGLAFFSIRAAFQYVGKDHLEGEPMKAIRDVLFACFCILVAILIRVW